MSLNLLGEASDVLDDAVDLNVALEAVAGLTVPAIADFCAIDVLSPQDVLSRVAVPRRPEAPWRQSVEAWFPADPEGDHPIATVLRGGQAQLVSDARSARSPDAHAVGAADLAPSSYLVVPLAARGHRVGVLSLVSWTPTHRYRLEDLMLACRLARQLALAVDNRQLGEEVWDFLRMVSHELRTPLAAIHGWVSLLRHHDLSAVQVSHGLDVLERNTRLQARVLDDILELVRLRSEAPALERRRVDLAAIAHEALATVAPDAAARNIRVGVKDDQQTGYAAGDPVRVRQLMAVAVSVALADPRTGGCLAVVLTRPAGSSVCFAVRRKASADRRSPSIEGAARVRRPGRRRAHSVGALLARRLAALQGGRIEIGEADSAGGLVIRIALPAWEQSDAEEHRGPPHDSPEEGVPALDGRRVLVIEDDADTREFLRLSLERRGATVSVAGSGAEALALLDRGPVDAVLSDLTLPGGDGYAVMRAIRARGLTRLPAIALSALTGPDERVDTAAAGFAEHLAKPIDPDHLARSLARAIRSAEVA